MARITRQDNVVDYLKDYCGGEKFYGPEVSRETIVANVAEEVIAWHDLVDTPVTQSLYRGIVRGMLEDGSLRIGNGMPVHTVQWIEIP